MRVSERKLRSIIKQVLNESLNLDNNIDEEYETHGAYGQDGNNLPSIEEYEEMLENYNKRDDIWTDGQDLVKAAKEAYHSALIGFINDVIDIHGRRAIRLN